MCMLLSWIPAYAGMTSLDSAIPFNFCCLPLFAVVTVPFIFPTPLPSYPHLGRKEESQIYRLQSF